MPKRPTTDTPHAPSPPSPPHFPFLSTTLHTSPHLPLFEQNGIKPTAIRLLVYDTLAKAGYALSLSDIEARLGTVDKSSIFRALTLFLAHHILHSVDDGSGMAKYAPCAPGCHCHTTAPDALSDLHTHFRCERCRRTFCLRGLPVPTVVLPEGFRLTSANYVLVGICPQCAGKTSRTEK